MKNLYRILIVDDDKISNYLTIATLQHVYEDAEISTALNGIEAMEYFQKTSDGFPEVVFLDINMPLMNGFEFLDWYENSIFKGTTKICMLTTSINKADKKKAGEYSDVVSYVEKPLKKESIDTLIENL